MEPLKYSEMNMFSTFNRYLTVIALILKGKKNVTVT